MCSSSRRKVTGLLGPEGECRQHDISKLRSIFTSLHGVKPRKILIFKQNLFRSFVIILRLCSKYYSTSTEGSTGDADGRSDRLQIVSPLV